MIRVANYFKTLSGPPADYSNVQCAMDGITWHIHHTLWSRWSLIAALALTQYFYTHLTGTAHGRPTCHGRPGITLLNVVPEIAYTGCKTSRDVDLGIRVKIPLPFAARAAMHCGIVGVREPRRMVVVAPQTTRSLDLSLRSDLDYLQTSQQDEISIGRATDLDWISVKGCSQLEGSIRRSGASADLD